MGDVDLHEEDALVRRGIRATWVLLLVAGLATCAAAAAAPSEIKVFTDELALPGEHTLETHVNKAQPGEKAENRSRPLQLMPEYSYGLHPNWEVSLQLPMSFGSEANRLQGYRAELQYIAPHDPEEGFYWGLNFELARIDPQGEPSFWNTELIPILGYRTGRWHLVANPGIDKAVSGTARTVNFEPAVKAAYRVEGRNFVGLEYYVDAGPLRHRLPAHEQDRVLYVAWDGRVGKSDLNIGVGRGLTDVSDRWVVKAICEFAF